MVKSENRSDFWGNVKIVKVAAPELGEGQGKLVATRELECFCCGKKVMLETENPLSKRPVEPMSVPKFAPGDTKMKNPIGMQDHFMMTQPTISPLSWRFTVPSKWMAVTTLPRSNWPGKFIKKIEMGVPPKVAVESCMKENEAYERWYCCALCRMLEELEGHAMQEGWTMWMLWWRKTLMKAIFFSTDIMPMRINLTRKSYMKNNADGDKVKITQNLKSNQRIRENRHA